MAVLRGGRIADRFKVLVVDYIEGKFRAAGRQASTCSLSERGLHESLYAYARAEAPCTTTLPLPAALAA